MNIQNVSYNEIITTSRKGITFTSGKPLEHKKHLILKDKDERYNMLGAVGGISVLAGLGVAIAYQANFLNLFTNKRSSSKFIDFINHKNKNETLMKHGINSYPYFDFAKNGKQAIHMAWSEHIDKIAQNLKDHDKIKDSYQKLFNRKSIQLDILEHVAKQRILAHGKKW